MRAGRHEGGSSTELNTDTVLPVEPRTRAALAGVREDTIMVEWNTGLVWLIAAIFAAFAALLAETQHARRLGLATSNRLKNAAPKGLPVIAGWPPGSRPSTCTNIGPPAALFLRST